MKYLLLAVLSIAAFTGCTGIKGERASVTYALTTLDSQGNLIARWTTSCKEHKHSCNAVEIKNARSIYMGNDVTYTCGLNSTLYMHVSTYRSTSSLEEVKGVNCTFSVTVTPVK